jgi:hypothetical protein
MAKRKNDSLRSLESWRMIYLIYAMLMMREIVIATALASRRDFPASDFAAALTAFFISELTP